MQTFKLTKDKYAATEGDIPVINLLATGTPDLQALDGHATTVGRFFEESSTVIGTDASRLKELQDSEVEVTGVVSGKFDNKMQLIGIPSKFRRLQM
jgi:hypothetical protein